MSNQPNDLDAECAVLGSVFVSPRQLAEVSEFLRAEDFYQPAHQAIYAAMLTLEAASTPVDVLTVAGRMQADGTAQRLSALGGREYLTDLIGKSVTVSSIAHHGRIVSELATRRRVIAAGVEIAAKGSNDTLSAQECSEQAEQALFAVTQARMRTGYEHAKVILRGTLEAVQQRYERKQAVTGVSTGFTKLDGMTCGLQPSELTILAARPSMGKTALAMNIAEHAAVACKQPVIVFSLEMSKQSLMERLVCARARIPSERMRTGMLTTADFTGMMRAASGLADAPLYIDESGSPTIAEIRSKCRRWRSDSAIFSAPGQIGLVIVDYLQLIQGKANREDNRQREISDISRALKALAKELGSPVVALSQLNRALESRADKRPLMSDLRESGAIEQDADLIAFIYRDEVYSKDECANDDRGVAEIIIAKQRNGATGKVRLAFKAEYTKFENLAEPTHYGAAPRYEVSE